MRGRRLNLSRSLVNYSLSYLSTDVLTEHIRDRFTQAGRQAEAGRGRHAGKGRQAGRSIGPAAEAYISFVRPVHGDCGLDLKISDCISDSDEEEEDRVDWEQENRAIDEADNEAGGGGMMSGVRMRECATETLKPTYFPDKYHPI